MYFYEKKIIKIYCAITGNTDISSVKRLLQVTKVYQEIKRKNPVFLYEGVFSNLLDMVAELKKKPGYPEELDRINPETISLYNRSLRGKRRNLHLWNSILYRYRMFALPRLKK